LGGITVEELWHARVILWKGHCSVHRCFSVAQIDKARRDHPGITVIVHPECLMEVVEAADMDGSTEFITRTITEAPPGSKFAVGTEINLVSRLARENPDRRSAEHTSELQSRGERVCRRPVGKTGSPTL